MKPLLILPPAPARWIAIERLYADIAPACLPQLRQRTVDGVTGAQDALALATHGTQFLSCGAIFRKGPIGVLTHLQTLPEHRRSGHARRVVDTLITWFEMTGGKLLYATMPGELATGWFTRLDFRVLHRAERDSTSFATAARGALPVPAEVKPPTPEPVIGPLSAADWPLLVHLLQHEPGPDPRVPIELSAVSAEGLATDLLSQQAVGTCVLRGAWQGERLVACGSVALDPLGDRTYAMAFPHNAAPALLREELIGFAQFNGYRHVEFPLEALAAG